ncbi:MAG: PKD domain-containing protein [Bacteroidales bacterium]
MKKIIFSILCSIYFLNTTYSQLVIRATASSNGVSSSDTLVICSGQTVDLSVNTNAGFATNNFNNGTLGTGWINTSANPVFNNPCQCPFIAGIPPVSCNNGSPVQTGPDSLYAWVNTTASPFRILATKSYDFTTFTTTGGCKVKWWMMYGITADSGSCEDPDASNEGVHLQYTTNDINWNDIPAPNNNPIGNLSATPPFITSVPGSGGYWYPSSALSSQLQSTLYFWNQYESDIPLIAYTPTTRFRFAQLTTSSAGYDAWGIDEVSISCNPVNQIVNWSNGVHQYTQQTTPLSNTMYTITITDTTTNPPTSVSDTVYIVVNPTPTADFTVLSPICTKDSSIISFTGNTANIPIFHWEIGGDTLKTIGNGAGPILVFWNNPFNIPSTINTISLIVENQFHCISIPVSHEVIINASPDLSFITSQPTEGCPPLTIHFQDESAPFVNNWNWNFGDGDSSNLQNPTHIYQTSGWFPLIFTAKSIQGCKRSFLQPTFAHVYNIPSPPDITKQGDTLFAHSSDGDNFQWYKNDSIINAANNNYYVPDEIAYYSVSVQSSSGCYSLPSAHLLSVDQAYLTAKDVILPNPCADYFSIKFNSIVNQVDILNLNGKLLKKFANRNIANTYYINELAKDMYLIKIYVDGIISMQKLIKY